MNWVMTWTKHFQKLINDFKICSHFYNILYNAIVDNFFDLVSSLSFLRIDDINEDIWVNEWGLKSGIQEYMGGVELLRSIDFFYQLNGRFSPKKELVHAPDGENHDFLEDSEKFSPVRLYEIFSEGKLYSLVCTQFACPVNVYLGGDQEISKKMQWASFTKIF